MHALFPVLKYIVYSMTIGLAAALFFVFIAPIFETVRMVILLPVVLLGQWLEKQWTKWKGIPD